MFQYACGRALALRNGDTLKLDITEWKLGREKIRSYLLPHFAITEEIATDDEVKKMRYPFGVFLGKVMNKIRLKMGFVNIAFDPRVISKKGDVYLDGYWQSEKYFADFAKEIRDDFALKLPMKEAAAEILEKIQTDEFSVSLNIRRGDNAHSPSSMKSFGCPGLDYYQSALDTLLEQMKAQKKFSGNINLFVFSDDIEWAKENLHTGFQTTFVSGPDIDTCEEMTLMSACRHNVISNSTFGWWGAWLNRNEGKIVVAPKAWALIKLKNYKDIIPDGWIRV